MTDKQLQAAQRRSAKALFNKVFKEEFAREITRLASEAAYKQARLLSKSDAFTKALKVTVKSWITQNMGKLVDKYMRDFQL